MPLDVCTNVLEYQPYNDSPSDGCSIGPGSESAQELSFHSLRMKKNEVGEGADGGTRNGGLTRDLNPVRGEW